MNIFVGLLIPFVGTTLGASIVFLMKDKINSSLEKVLLGFASGVMIAASIWSLLIPAIDIESKKSISWFVPSVGFLVGVFFLLLLDRVVPHMHLDKKIEGSHTKLDKTTMMFLAITLHNIPEGLAVGILFAGALGNASVSLASAFALSIGIAIQNFPEGAIVSMPFKSEGLSKKKSFLIGMISGLIEPIVAIFALFLTNFINILMPFLLSFAAGAMIYVVAEELIPESQFGKHSDLATIGLAMGFVIMMILDISLG